jgi:hypothetical protein
MSYRLTDAQLHAPPHRRPVTALKKPKGLGGAARGELAALGLTRMECNCDLDGSHHEQLVGAAA